MYVSIRRTIGLSTPTFFTRLLRSNLTHLIQKGRPMDHEVKGALKDQLNNFVELLRVRPSYFWALPLWLTRYSMQDSFSMARSTGSCVFPPGGDFSAAFMCDIICVNVHEENPGFFRNASNFIINGGTFICHISDTNHRGMHVCRSLPVLYQLSIQYTMSIRKKIFNLYRTIIWRLFAVISSSCSEHQLVLLHISY